MEFFISLVGRQPMTAISKNISKKGPLNCRSLFCAPPDLLLRLMALMHFMRG